MLPTLRQRLFIATAVVLCGLVWLATKPGLTASDGSSGISLFSARGGPLDSSVLAVAAAVPALLMALAASTWGNPLTGVFVTAAALIVLTANGGSIDGWWDRTINESGSALPQAYLGLVLETVIWHLPLVLLILAIGKFRLPLRQRWSLPEADEPDTTTAWRGLDLQSVLSGLICAVVSTVLCLLILPVPDTKQVIIGLIIAFTLGGLIGHLFFPVTNPICILLSPAVVAIATYVFVAWRFDTTQQLLTAARDQSLTPLQRLPGPAMALPIHYASSAVAGAAIGVGWAQTLLSDSRESNQPHGATDRPQRGA